MTDKKIANLKEIKVEKVEGTMYFYAAEMCKEDADFIFEGPPLDIWALGVTVYCLVYLKLPFFSETGDYFELLDKISEAKLDFHSDVPIDSGLLNILKRMLDKNPSTRITCKELILDDWLNENRTPLCSEK